MMQLLLLFVAFELIAVARCRDMVLVMDVARFKVCVSV